MNINRNYLELGESYLFSTISTKVAAYREAHPGADIIPMGIGDVTRPLPQVSVEAMCRASEELGRSDMFRGYGPEQGYPFLREAIAGYYKGRGTAIDPGEVFVSDGAKCDVANILDIFGEDNRILLPDPVYPVYLDTNRMLGRAPFLMDANEVNGFLPLPDMRKPADIIYLCSPNNPTGAAYGREALGAWVEAAIAWDAVILYDGAYEAFIRDPDLPRSIFEIPGARSCAIEINSFSKTAGFTGARLGWTVVPRELERQGVSLHRLWSRRQTTKFNGASYPVQRAGEAALTKEGLREIQASLAYYRTNADLIAGTLRKLDISFTGGENSPYIWMKTPRGMDSWTFFDWMLENIQVIGTPGSGFGSNGQGYFRLTAFGTQENTRKAMERLGRAI